MAPPCSFNLTMSVPAATLSRGPRLLLLCTYGLVAVAFPITIWQLAVNHAEKHSVAWFIGGLFVLAATLMSIHDSTGSLAAGACARGSAFCTVLVWS